MVIFNRNDFFYPVLAIASILLVTYQNLGMNKTLELFPQVIKQPLLVNDHVNGGRSIGSVSTDNGMIQLDCKTQKAENIFPFCSFILPVSTDEHNGIDLSNYQSMDIRLSLKTEANAKDSVLIYLLNSEQSNDGTLITRSNLRTLNPTPESKLYSLRLDSFFVPSWWLFANADFVEDGGDPNLSNITGVQVSTGDNPFERTETIQIDSIVLNGKWLSTQQVIFFLLAIWVTVITIHIFYGLLRLHRKLNRTNLQATELMKLNRLLSIEKNKFESMAKVDPLTKAFNRAGIRDILDQAVAQYKKDRTPCSIIMLDIDHFKAVNDNFGHGTGDQILIDLVNVINSNTRNLDCLARWGGEEFLLICPGITAEKAVMVAEKHRKAIAESERLDGKITCSFGVSELKDKGISDCFKQADIALYQAKSNGRNQVVGAS